MLIKKTIVMSSLDNMSEKAVCNIEKQGNTYEGTLRLYNFNDEPEGILSLGFLSGGKVYKSGLTKKNKNLYTFQTTENLDINKLSLALMRISINSTEPILYGTTSNNKITENEIKLACASSVLDEKIDYEKTKKVLDENEIFLEEQEEIEKLIDNELKDEKCANCTSCKYREAFFEPPTDNEEIIEEKSFLSDIKEQLDLLFEKYPEEEILAQIFPHSKWAKVDYENSGNYYVVGVIYEDNQIKYIVYGVPGIYSEQPPEELKGFSRWLPIDPEKPQDFGYWLSYQDAESGEEVEVNVI